MRFCPACKRVLTRQIDGGRILFVCTICQFSEPGNDHDVKVATGLMRTSDEDDIGKYHRLLENASFDRVNQQVAKDCAKCGLDYMTQIRLSHSETVIWSCQCGFWTSAIS